MLVSVIIPTYNRAIYLREALNNILAQVRPADEIIVVDDGSTDDTSRVLEQYRDVRVFRQEHLGVAAARNLGLKMARGVLIAWLDSDDLWEPDFLATVVPFFSKDDTVDGVYTGITMIDEQGVLLSASARVETPRELHDALLRGNFLATPAVVIRKVCFDKVGDFDTQFRIAEDADMWLRLSSQFHIVGIPQSLVRIRVHPTNTMSDMDGFCKAHLMLVRKHFGEMVGDGQDLSDRSRAAYAYAFRSISLAYIQNGQSMEGWDWLKKAIMLYPQLVERLDTFYELACGEQPRGVRGKATLLDITTNGTELVRQLDALFASTDMPVQNLKKSAYGNTYLALAMLSDQAGQWKQARWYLVQAFKANPRLCYSWSVLRRFLKLHSAKRLVDVIRRIRGTNGRSR